MVNILKKGLLISGGHIDVSYIKNYILSRKYDVIIAIDGGLGKAKEIGVYPTYIVGDFDTVDEGVLRSYEAENTSKIIRLIPEKDDTDTQVAVRIALEQKCDIVDIVGGTGTRLDHTIANIHILQLFLKNGIEATIVNENNRIRLINSSYTIKRNNTFGKYISFLAFTDKVLGITLKGMKYPLKDYNFDKETTLSLGVSNELVDEIGEVTIKSGILIMIESRD